MTIQIYELCGADETVLFSPHCWKVRMAIAHKGLDYRTIPTPFTKVATMEGGVSRKIPVIRDGDIVVEESFEIAKYLEETYPDGPSLFNGEGGLALTQMVINWSQTQIHPALVRLCLLDIYSCLAPDDQTFFRETREKLFGCTLEEFEAKFPKNSEALNAALLPLNLTLKKQPFIGGNSPLFADYVVFGGLQWMRVVAGDTLLPTDGPVGEWFSRLLDMYGGMGRKTTIADTARA